MYLGAVVATAAVIAGFGAAVLVYGPSGMPYRQTSSSGTPLPPVGIEFGTAEESFVSALNLHNASVGNASWNWSGGGPCSAPGVLNLSNEYQAFNTNATPANVTAQNVTLVCLNSVAGGVLNATWYYNSTGTLLVNNTYNTTTGMANGSYYSSSLMNVSSCNYYNATSSQGWNATHVANATSGAFTPCNTYYEMNQNVNMTPSFAGLNNSSAWAPNETGYGASDIAYELPVYFLNNSKGGVYEISVAITGVTPVAQTFFFNDQVNGTGFNGTVLFVFDMTAAWLYDASYNMSGMPSNSSVVEIYGAIGVPSTIVTECSSSGVCPDQSSAIVASEA